MQATKQLTASELSPSFRRKARPSLQLEARARHQLAEQEAEAYRQTVLRTEHRSAGINLGASQRNQQDKPTNRDESAIRGQLSRSNATVRHVALTVSKHGQQSTMTCRMWWSRDQANRRTARHFLAYENSLGGCRDNGMRIKMRFATIRIHLRHFNIASDETENFTGRLQRLPLDEAETDPRDDVYLTIRYTKPKPPEMASL